MAEGLERRSAEIGRGIDQIGRHPLDRSLDRQDHVGQPDIDKDDEGADERKAQRIAADHRDREYGVEHRRQMQLREHPVDDALLGQDQLPRIDLDQIARPQRQHDREVEQRFPAPLDVACGHIGDRERHDHRGERHRRGHQHRSDDDIGILRLEQLRIGRERELAHHQSGEIVDVEKALQQQREQRAEIDDPEPQHRRRQEQQHQKLRPAPEHVRQRPERAAASTQDGALDAHAGSIRCSASLAKPSVTRSPSAGISCVEGIEA